MFTVFLLTADPNSKGRTCIALDAPNASSVDVQEAIGKALALRDPHHVGVQVFDGNQWEFSEPIMFNENFEFDFQGEY